MFPLYRQEIQVLHHVGSDTCCLWLLLIYRGSQSTAPFCLHCSALKLNSSTIILKHLNFFKAFSSFVFIYILQCDFLSLSLRTLPLLSLNFTFFLQLEVTYHSAQLFWFLSQTASSAYISGSFHSLPSWFDRVPFHLTLLSLPTHKTLNYGDNTQPWHTPKINSN